MQIDYGENVLVSQYILKNNCKFKMVRKNISKKKKLRGKSTFVGSILSIFNNNPFRAYNYKQISHLLGTKNQASKDLIITVLKGLSENNEIYEIKPGKFKLNSALINDFMGKKSYITGIVDMKRTGKAYVIPENGGEDIYISANNTYRSLNGDKVKVFLFPKRKGRKTEGQIIEIISRDKKQHVGTIGITRNFAFLVPDSTSLPVDIFIPKSAINKAKNGQKVIVSITEWPEHSKNPFGEVIKILGYPGDNNVEMQSILAEYDFPLSFPANAEKEAENISAEITNSEMKNRRDYRRVFTITIDPRDAKDFDDALSLKKLNNGNWEVGIHIADVSHYVKPGLKLNKEAYKRGTSVYLVDRVIPMLPEKLSNFVCSLRPNEEKLCFSVIFEMEKNAKIVNTWFGKTIINSNRRLNYGEAQKIIETEKGNYAEEICVLNDLATKLRNERFKNGAINFQTQEVKFNLDKNGKPIGIYIKEQKEANKLIEEFMLLANNHVAEFIGKMKGKHKPKTFIYRIHDKPNAEKLNTFVQFLEKLGYNLNISTQKNISKSLNNLFKEISGRAEENMIETIAIRTMSKAEYSTHNIGHYGLAFPYYTHFTSPIRRYPDLVTHRLLNWYLHNEPSVNQKEYEEICEHSSEMERKAVGAERDSIKYKQAEFLLNKVGKEFCGLISGVSKWGLYVEIEENKCEGMIHLKDMKDDFYYLDEDNYRIIGQSFGNTYKLGDKVNIKVKDVDLSRKQIDFLFVD